MDAPLRMSGDAVAMAENGEMLLPAELRRRSRGEKCRRQLWWLTFTTSFANVQIYRLNYLVAPEKLPEFWRDNQDALMLANWILLALGLLTFCGLTIYYLRRPAIQGEDTSGERVWQGFRVPKWSRLAGYSWSAVVHVTIQSLPCAPPLLPSSLSQIDRAAG